MRGKEKARGAADSRPIPIDINRCRPSPASRALVVRGRLISNKEVDGNKAGSLARLISLECGSLTPLWPARQNNDS
jgi:hypothetical protein